MSDRRLPRIWALLEVGRAGEAAAMAREVLLEHPGDPAVLDALAVALLCDGQQDGARAAAEQLLAVTPDSGRAHQLHGFALSNLGKTGAAIEALREATRLDPMDADSHRVLAECLVRRRIAARNEEPDLHLLAALHLAPERADTHLAVARVALARRRWDEALAAAQRAIALDPVNPRAHEVLGAVAEKTGRIGEAGDHYVAAARLDPTGSSGRDRLKALAGAGVAAGAIGGVAPQLLRLVGLDGEPTNLQLAVLGGLLAVMCGWCFVTWLRRGRPMPRLSAEARAVVRRDRALSRGPRWRPIALALGVAVGVGALVLSGAVPDDEPTPQDLFELGTIPGVQLVPCEDVSTTTVLDDPC